MKKPIHMQTGVNIGDYGFDPDKVLDLMKKYKFGKENGGLFNYLVIRVDQKAPTSEQLYEWADYFRRNEIYFSIVDNYYRGRADFTCRRSKEDMEKIAELGGEYYLGEEIGEFGGWYAGKVSLISLRQLSWRSPTTEKIISLCLPRTRKLLLKATTAEQTLAITASPSLFRTHTTTSGTYWVKNPTLQT